jgi:hypothetical protein
MGNTPRANEEKMRRVMNAWQTLENDKKFGGMTLDEFKARIKPALDVRQEQDQAEEQLREIINRRDDLDEVAMGVVQLAVNGVIGDPEFGPNSALYEAFGYTRTSERKSGKTNKTKTTPKP